MPKSVEYRWEICRIASRNIHVGNVVARDEKDALKAAIRNLHHKRLVARRLEPVARRATFVTIPTGGPT